MQKHHQQKARSEIQKETKKMALLMQKHQQQKERLESFIQNIKHWLKGIHSKSESPKKQDQRACCWLQLFLFVEFFYPAIYIYKNKHEISERRRWRGFNVTNKKTEKPKRHNLLNCSRGRRRGTYTLHPERCSWLVPKIGQWRGGERKINRGFS